MRKLAIVGAAIGLLAGVTSTVSIASASAAPHRVAPHGSAASVKVLHLISRQTSLKVIDLGKKGPSAGDQVMEGTADFQHGKLVDRGFLNCVGITVSGHAFHVVCHGAMVFRDGQVELQGETDFHEPFTVGVIGGTGAYQNAGGQITVERTLSDGTTDVETLRLILDTD
jgi:hypothetical protein